MSFARLRLHAVAVSASMWCAGALAAPPVYQHYHSHEEDLHDIREQSEPLRRRASERIGWRDEKSKRDPVVRIKVLGINDFHGQLSAGRLISGRPVGSAPVLAAWLRSAAASAQDGHLLIHAGDHVGASPPASALLQDEPSIQFLNQLANRECRRSDPRRPAPWWVQVNRQPHCNVVGTLGNHEFDEGVTEILRLIGGGNHSNGPFLESPWRGARFPYVIANVVRRSDGQPLLPPYTIRQI